MSAYSKVQSEPADTPRGARTSAVLVENDHEQLLHATKEDVSSVVVSDEDGDGDVRAKSTARPTASAEKGLRARLLSAQRCLRLLLMVLVLLVGVLLLLAIARNVDYSSVFPSFSSTSPSSPSSSPPSSSQLAPPSPVLPVPSADERFTLRSANAALLSSSAPLLWTNYTDHESRVFPMHTMQQYWDYPEEHPLYSWEARWNSAAAERFQQWLHQRQYSHRYAQTLNHSAEDIARTCGQRRLFLWRSMTFGLYSRIFFHVRAWLWLLPTDFITMVVPSLGSLHEQTVILDRGLDDYFIPMSACQDVVLPQHEQLRRSGLTKDVQLIAPDWGHFTDPSNDASNAAQWDAWMARINSDEYGHFRYIEMTDINTLVRELHVGRFQYVHITHLPIRAEMFGADYPRDEESNRLWVSFVLHQVEVFCTRPNSRITELGSTMLRTAERQQAERRFRALRLEAAANRSRDDSANAPQADSNEGAGEGAAGAPSPSIAQDSSASPSPDAASSFFPAHLQTTVSFAALQVRRGDKAGEDVYHVLWKHYRPIADFVMQAVWWLRRAIPNHEPTHLQATTSSGPMTSRSSPIDQSTNLTAAEEQQQDDAEDGVESHYLLVTDDLGLEEAVRGWSHGRGLDVVDQPVAADSRTNRYWVGKSAIECPAEADRGAAYLSMLAGHLQRHYPSASPEELDSRRQALLSMDCFVTQVQLSIESSRVLVTSEGSNIAIHAKRYRCAIAQQSLCYQAQDASASRILRQYRGPTDDYF